MEKKRIRDAAWFPTAVAICIGVILYILLSRFTGICGGIKTFLGFFKTVILGCVTAYLVNPLANLFAKRFQRVIAFILAVYLLSEKESLKTGFERLLKAVFGAEKFGGVSTFLHKCDTICNRYIVYNLIDSLIVGAANAIFMVIAGMQYVGLISFVVALTNLVPTFGPMIGLVIGGFVLLMVNPMHALIFVIFTLVLQTCDGYVIKPRLFGNSLGVSGLWILISVIVGGNMFGVIGILLAVPCMTILILIYETYILPGLEGRF